MKNTTLTIALNAEKLDALIFHTEKESVDLQNELNETIQKLYGKYMSQAVRECIGDKMSRDAAGRERPRRPSGPVPRPATEATTQEKTGWYYVGIRAEKPPDE